MYCLYITFFTFSDNEVSNCVGSDTPKVTIFVVADVVIWTTLACVEVIFQPSAVLTKLTFAALRKQFS